MTISDEPDRLVWDDSQLLNFSPLREVSEKRLVGSVGPMEDLEAAYVESPVVLVEVACSSHVIAV